MNSAKSMVYWVDCALEYNQADPMSSPAARELFDYFSIKQNIEFTQVDYDGLCGPTSVIMDEIVKLETRLITDNKVTVEGMSTVPTTEQPVPNPPTATNHIPADILSST